MENLDCPIKKAYIVTLIKRGLKRRIHRHN